MAMTSMSIVLTVVVLQLHHVGPNQKQVPRWLKRIVIDVIARALCMGSYVDNHYSHKHKVHQRQHQHHSNSDMMTSSSARPNDIHARTTSSANGRNSARKDSNISCNGGLNNSGHLQLRPLLSKSNLTHHSKASSLNDNAIEAASAAYGDNVVYDKISRQLKILVSNTEVEDDYQDLVNEWRLVAHVMDRLLFWLFLIGALASSISILVLMPMMKPPIRNL